MRVGGFIGAACLMALATGLSGCVASINANDHDDDGWRHSHPRTATDLCRREVERTYEDNYRIAFELPSLRSLAMVSPVPPPGTVAPVPGAAVASPVPPVSPVLADAQQVEQPFTLTPRREGGVAMRQTLVCTVNSGVITALAVTR